MFARVCLLGALIACAGCGDSMSPSDPASNIAGSWTGMIGSPMSGSAVRITWTPNQVGNAAQGVARLAKPAIGTEVAGTMSGLMTGNRVGLSFTGGRQAIPSVPDCAVFGSGEATIGGNSISGTFNLTATAGCAPIGIEPLSNAPLSLTR